MKSINVVIPCYNEEKNISLFYEEALKVVKNDNYHIQYVYIDDGSQDNTKIEIKKLQEEYENVKGLYFSRNFGKEATIIAGLDYSKNVDATIIIDADLQMPLDHINEMIEFWENGFKLILTYKVNRAKGIKSFLAVQFYSLFNKVSDIKINNDILDFQLMDKEVVNVICSFRERKRFFKGITGFIGYDYKLIGVSIIPRREGESKFGSFKSLFSYAFVSLANNSTIFLKLSMFIGFLFTFLSFIYVVFIVIRQLLFNVSVPGWTSLVSLMLFFFGIVLIMLGIIGYYLGLIYEEVKQRPLYILDEDKE